MYFPVREIRREDHSGMGGQPYLPQSVVFAPQRNQEDVMSNWIDYNVDVLASNPREINLIAERIKEPSDELVSRLAEVCDGDVETVANNVRELVEFNATENLGYTHDSVNKARQFHTASKDKYSDIVWSHLIEVSEAFPRAIFLLEYFDMQYSYSGKVVIRAGQVLQRLHDGNQRAQAVDWALLDIFAPFRAEYSDGREFGSLWSQWLDDVTACAEGLRSACRMTTNS